MRKLWKEAECVDGWKGMKWEGQKGEKAEMERMDTWGKETRQEGRWSPGQRIKNGAWVNNNLVENVVLKIWSKTSEKDCIFRVHSELKGKEQWDLCTTEFLTQLLPSCHPYAPLVLCRGYLYPN